MRKCIKKVFAFLFMKKTFLCEEFNKIMKTIKFILNDVS